MAELNDAQTQWLAQGTAAFGQVPEGYLQPQMGYKMNYGGASDTGFKGILEHGARKFQSERVAERFTPYPNTGSYGVTFMRPTDEKGIPLAKGNNDYECGYTLNSDGVLRFFHQKLSIQQ